MDKAQLGGKTADAFIAGQPELVTNGSFDTDVSGWTDKAGNDAGTSIAQDAGRGRLICASPFDGMQTPLSTAANDWYVLTADVESDDSWSIRQNTVVIASGVATSGVLQLEVFFQATADDVELIVQAGNATPTIHVDNVSVKALPGIHMIAAQDTDRATRQQVGGKEVFDFDGIDDGYNLTGPLTGVTTLFVGLRTTVTHGILLSHGGVDDTKNPFGLVWEDGNANWPNAVPVASETRVDGAVIGINRDALHTAIADGNPHVVMQTGLSLGAADPAISGYQTFSLWRPEMDLSVVAVTANLTTEEAANMRTWIANESGATLS